MARARRYPRPVMLPITLLQRLRILVSTNQLLDKKIMLSVSKSHTLDTQPRLGGRTTVFIQTRWSVVEAITWDSKLGRDLLLWFAGDKPGFEQAFYEDFFTTVWWCLWLTRRMWQQYNDPTSIHTCTPFSSRQFQRILWNWGYLCHDKHPEDPYYLYKKPVGVLVFIRRRFTQRS